MNSCCIQIMDRDCTLQNDERLIYGGLGPVPFLRVNPGCGVGCVDFIPRSFLQAPKLLNIHDPYANHGLKKLLMNMLAVMP